MWTRKFSERLFFNSSLITDFPIAGDAAAAFYKQTWGEKPLAEDHSVDGLLSGWPPRSYPCSFCRREFRSAQALGGHMNVHRRDRARLNNLSLMDAIEEKQDVQEHHMTSSHGSDDIPNQKPNPRELGEEALLSPSHQKLKKDRICHSVSCSMPRSGGDLKLYGFSDLMLKRDMDEDESNSKRRRRMNSASQSMNPFMGEKKQQKPENLISFFAVDQELDLELRLGDLPRV